MINVDESDIIKPYGFKFKDLSKIHDGSKEGRPKEKKFNINHIFYSIFLLIYIQSLIH